MADNKTDIHAVRLYNPNAATPRIRRRPYMSNMIEEGPGPLGSTGFGEELTEAQIKALSEFQGPGGQAPPFAPGGPENPYPPSAGMPPNPSTNLPTSLSTSLPANFPANLPEASPLRPLPHQGISAAGGAGIQKRQLATLPKPGLPGHGTTPGQFQPGGGVSKVPQGLTQQQLAQGFMARIIPVTGGAPPTVGGGPVVPPPVIGGGPVIPGAPPPQVGGGPIMPPPVIGGGPIIPPEEGGGPTSGKPRGVKPVPMPPGKTPPDVPPKPPGQWITLDAGRGQPPAYAFIESTDSGTDDGLEGPPRPKPSGGVTKPPLGGEKGHYVPIKAPYMVQPVVAGDEDDVIWAWVPTIDSSYGVKEPESEPKPKA